jgi:hypothetical protein
VFYFSISIWQGVHLAPILGERSRRFAAGEGEHPQGLFTVAHKRNAGGYGWTPQLATEESLTALGRRVRLFMSLELNSNQYMH